ncbi:patatin-like phospholipase family protein [Alkalibacter saccharofermentans]|uniref:NTE family protein n=1 Tax=Alkalibacter saccharofermentans DSM 14828 TaxID=1120975 RepID=A0A1M4YBN4_9FIRM|nr:patatin-like phospholipase family protein [Alkalibacter saccharofermentans]SHF03147.1 NTE family protein [Alkalibacter saccharofermentans DSM 14828]
MEYGLVLSGGGAKGSFEIGVWKALREMDIKISAVAGTSVGALNGAIIAQNDFDFALEFWSNLSMDQVFAFNQKITDKYISEWSRQDWNTFATSFKDYVFDGGLDVTPLKNNLKKHIDEDRIRNSPIKLGLVTVSLSDLKPLELMIDDIPKGKLIDYLLASAAFPAFKKHEIDGKTYIDGAVYDNFPIDLLADRGYKNLIAVELPSPPGFKLRKKRDDLNIINITNSEYLGLILEFDPELMKKNIQMGYLDTLKKFKVVKGKNYYIDVTRDNESFLRFQQRLGFPIPGDDGMKLPLLLGREQLLGKEEAYDEIKKLLGYTSFRNQDPCLSMLEITAKNLDIPRLKKYTTDELTKEIFKAVNALIDENLSLIKNHRNILNVFKESDEDISPMDSLRFLTYYMYFLSLNVNSKFPLGKLINRFTPEVSLSILTLLYLTNR